MWVYNKTNQGYSLKWGERKIYLIPKDATEVPEEIATAYWGYQYGVDRDIDDSEAKYLVKIMKQRWESNGVKGVTDSFLNYNMPDSVFYLAESFDEIQKVIKSGQTNQVSERVSGNTK